jgi:aryl-alcohol dehydrogenase-like predicted oxidoreductase
MIRRREFLGTLAAGAASAREWRNRQPGMNYRRLGRTGFMVSEIVMGGNLITPDNCEHVLAAIDAGLNYLDTAPAYGRGRSELGFARVLRSRPRDRVFLTTKVSLWDGNRNKLYREIFDSLPASEQKRLQGRIEQELARRGVLEPDYLVNYFPAQVEEVRAAALANVMSEQYGRSIDRDRNFRQLIIDSVEESLKRLGTDYVDVITCPHGASTPFEVLGYPETFEAFEKLKKEGKVRHLSVSAHSDPAGVLRAAVEARAYSMAMIAYNIVNHTLVAPALEEAARNDVGVIAMKVARPVHDERPGFSADPRRLARLEQAVPGPLKTPQKAYVWALRNRNIAAVISEMGTLALVKDNLPLAGGAYA